MKGDFNRREKKAGSLLIKTKKGLVEEQNLKGSLIVVVTRQRLGRKRYSEIVSKEEDFNGQKKKGKKSLIKKREEDGSKNRTLRAAGQWRLHVNV